MRSKRACLAWTSESNSKILEQEVRKNRAIAQVKNRNSLVISQKK